MNALNRVNSLPVLVVGAGVAGLTATLDLARLGVPVHLVEREGHLGGQVMHLDKLYPSDHCAFCPVWPDGAACLAHPLVTVHNHTSLVAFDQGESGVTAVLAVKQPVVDLEVCVFCGLCREACEARGVSGAVTLRPAGLTWDPAVPPAPLVDSSLCSRCGECVAVCSTGAIDPARFDRPADTLRLAVADVIFATGFTEHNPALVTEYSPEGHPDIFTAMDFEAWTAEAGVNAGLVIRRSNGATPRSLAFIQCAGARDQRFLAHCSSVCCMHALKQARWIKRRVPDASVAIFFTDLRTVGVGYEAYARAAAREGVYLVRSRPGLIFPLSEGSGGSTLAVRYEDSATDQVVTAEFDMVVLNGGLVACPLPGKSSLGHLSLPPGRSCGFCQEPGDVSQAVIQGSRAAALVAVRLLGRNGDGI
jgi:heterodisulfide reductase subunit A2